MLAANQPSRRTEPVPSDGSSFAIAVAGHLRPDRVGLGDTGVFAGDWSQYDRDGASRVPVGFVGTLVDWWNGWAVFTCARQVAEAIVAQQEQLRDVERRRLYESGLAGAELAESLDEAIPPMYWDGDDIILDETAQYGPGDGVSRISPDQNGYYNVNGWRWTWQLVDPVDCDSVVGAIPLSS